MGDCMPALFTHYKFGQDVMSNLDEDIKKSINDNINFYNMFNQGFDNLYYHFKWQYYKKFGIKAHSKNIDHFFKNLIKYIKNNNLQDDSTCTNMIYGFINHYTLDTILHPFINYQTENLNLTHTRIEFMLDSKIKNNELQYKLLIPRLKFNTDLIELITTVFKETHNMDNIGKIFMRSHNNGYYLFQLSQNTFYIKKFDDRILNNNKLDWHHPKNKNEVYNYSLEELYNISLEIAVKLNTQAYKILHDEEQLDDLISNIKLINLKSILQLLEK